MPFFPAVFAHFMPLCHILVILAVFQTFSLLLYVLWESVVSNFLMLLLQLTGGSEPFLASKYY